MRKTLSLVVLVIGTFLCGPAFPQDAYPSKPLRIIVPFAPGGGIDILGRTLGQKLSERWKQPVVIENRPGASGAIGFDLAAKAPPDGYSILMSVNTMIMLPSLGKKIPFDPIKDFAPVAPVAVGTMAFVVPPSLGVKTMPEFVALAKKEPGKLNYGSPGNGTPHHLSMELFKQRAGIDLTHIPYKGSDGMMTGILGGQIGAVFMPVHQALTNVQAGRLVMLSSSGTKRSNATPNVPSLGEAAGIRDIDVDIWFGVYLQAATPRDIVAKLNAEVNAILKSPDVVETLAKQGLQPTGGTPEDLAALTSSDLARWAKVIQDAHIKAD